MRISKAAFDLIVAEEVSSQAYYTKHYQNFEWPGGASGPTVGIGYDCGYCTKEEIARDWDGILDGHSIAMLQAAAGKKGAAGQAFVAANGRSVTIPWAAAIKEFEKREIPKWEARTDKSLPNTELLSGDSYGALVSIAYNRGTGGFTASGDRYTELRNIRSMMIAKNFTGIPAQIRSMKRLWNNGLVGRREREAKLFERGLQVEAGKPPQPIPNRTTDVVKTVVKAGTATGVGTGAGSAVAAPQHAHWLVPLTVILSVLVAVGVAIYVTRHRQMPMADPEITA